mgnify:FL=1
MLTNEAFNALLKTLEEPPPQVIMILATTEYQKLPETIVSRCQRFDFRNVSNSEVVKRLKFIAENENIDCKEEILWFIAENSSGSLRDACNLLEQLSIAFDEITIDKARELFGIIDENLSLSILKMIIDDNKKELIETLQDLRLRGIDFKMLSSSIIDVLRLGIFTVNGSTEIQGYSTDFIKSTSSVFDGIESKKLIIILEKFIEMISLRTEHFDPLLDSSLMYLTFMFESKAIQKEELPIEKNIAIEDSQKNDTPVQKNQPTEKNIVIEDSQKNDTPVQKNQLPADEIEEVSIPVVDSGEKQDWEKVLFDLRRAKFGKMVLGALLRNVEVPKKVEDRLILKFKSKSLHDHFKVEWELELAREAVKKAVTQVYGNGIKLVLEEPDEEQKSNPKSNLLESDIVKSALAMGAKVEEEREG